MTDNIVGTFVAKNFLHLEGYIQLQVENFCPPEHVFILIRDITGHTQVTTGVGGLGCNIIIVRRHACQFNFAVESSHIGIIVECVGVFAELNIDKAKIFEAGQCFVGLLHIIERKQPAFFHKNGLSNNIRLESRF
ncbi:MAG: hypothetical protein BWY70_00398 [Bacteroidetes bacterium ADurb.Bin408]|nr:MAG: hypothetical protein BWY70_00398 [Bacteroidetes bacterium ADurb.Bin408]